MTVEFKNPWMGVVIPSVLICYLHLSTSYLMYWDYNVTQTKLKWFNGLVVMIYLSYYLAIVTPAGSPKKNFTPSSEVTVRKSWIKYCIKCQNYKPERTHHCRRCGECVLKMDHHCPWTNNCIGYKNSPHFTRFVFWVVVTVGYGFSYYVQRLINFYKSRDLPAYLISPLKLSLTILNFLIFGFVFLTVGILLFRTFTQALSNVTTIEDWEMDRIQDKFFDDDFWLNIKSNYLKFNPDSEFPELTSWKVNYRILKKGTNVPLNFTFEDFVFPYDLGSGYANMIDTFGPIYQWLWPWGGPKGDGMHFIIDALNEDQLKLPFPPDGGDYDPLRGITQKVERDEENEVVVKTWSNYLGETLNDFGVDLETEKNQVNSEY